MRSRQILGFHFRKLIITHIFHKPEFACRFHSVWVGRAVLDFYEDPLVVSVFGKALWGGDGGGCQMGKIGHQTKKIIIRGIIGPFRLLSIWERFINRPLLLHKALPWPLQCHDHCKGTTLNWYGIVRRDKLLNTFHLMEVVLISGKTLFQLCTFLFLQHQRTWFLHPNERKTKIYKRKKCDNVLWFWIGFNPYN
jgi:hypothetical protein